MGDAMIEGVAKWRFPRLKFKQCLKELDMSETTNPVANTTSTPCACSCSAPQPAVATPAVQPQAAQTTPASTPAPKPAKRNPRKRG